MNVLAPIIFRFPAGLARGARRVAVVGPFNGWDPTAHAMSRRADGDWTVTIYLPRGRVVYLFDVDGECWLDPDDEERMPNSWGSEYSVRYVGAAPAGAKDAEASGTPPGRDDATNVGGKEAGGNGVREIGCQRDPADHWGLQGSRTGFCMDHGIESGRRTGPGAAK